MCGVRFFTARPAGTVLGGSACLRSWVWGVSTTGVSARVRRRAANRLRFRGSGDRDIRACAEGVGIRKTWFRLAAGHPRVCGVGSLVGRRLADDTGSSARVRRGSWPPFTACRPRGHPRAARAERGPDHDVAGRAARVIRACGRGGNNRLLVRFHDWVIRVRAEGGALRTSSALGSSARARKRGPSPKSPWIFLGLSACVRRVPRGGQRAFGSVAPLDSL